MNKLKIAVCQIRTELDRSATMAKAQSMIAEAAKNGTDIAVLPEMFNCPYSGKWFKEFMETDTKESIAAMAAWAKENRILLVGGSIPEVEGEKLYNTCYVFDSQGQLIAEHRKVHLFDVDLPGMVFHESDHFSAGESITVFDTPFGKMGVAVCFDVRFPELFRAMAVRGAKVIFLPAQFNMTTGPVHWETAFRQRAIENQVYMIGTAAANDPEASYAGYGHSIITDPWGRVLMQMDRDPGIAVTEIDLDYVDEVRHKLPLLSARRTDLYTLHSLC